MDIINLRKEIDRIDTELLNLFEQRMDCVKKIGAYKKENNLPLKDAEREKAHLSALCEKSRPEFEEYVKALFSSLFEISIDYQMISQ